MQAEFSASVKFLVLAEFHTVFEKSPKHGMAIPTLWFMAGDRAEGLSMGARLRFFSEQNHVGILIPCHFNASSVLGKTQVLTVINLENHGRHP